MHIARRGLCPWHIARRHWGGNATILHLRRHMRGLQRRLLLLTVLLLRQLCIEIGRRRHLRELRLHLWRHMPLRLRLMRKRVE